MPVLPLLAGILTAAVGCGDPATVRPGDVRRYDAPKPPVAGATRAEQPPAAPGGLAVRYEPPSGWTDRGASGMRLATLVIGEGKDGHEVTVIPAAGTLKANVTRWLGQLDPGAAEAALADRTTAALAAAVPLEIDGTTATVVMLPAEAAAADAEGEAILGAAIPLDESRSLFVKFKGPAAVARRERDNFMQFVSSLRWK
jgi:hypothetical protein